MLYLISIILSMLYCKKNNNLNICLFLMNIFIMKIVIFFINNIFFSLCYNENCGKKYNVYSIVIICKMYLLLNI